MKLHRHSPTTRVTRVKPRCWCKLTQAARLLCTLSVGLGCGGMAIATDSEMDASAVSQTVAEESDATSQPQATALLRQVLQRIALGPAFDAKIRETVWTTGREVVGVGTYEQAGGGSGQFNLQVTMHDGDGKHRLQQISDGRLAWTRSEIADTVTLRRVDVGRLDEWVRQTDTAEGVAPRLKIGGWTEMLDTIDRDYIVRVDGAKLQSKPVWVITGTLRKEVRQKMLTEAHLDQWPPLCPTKVRVAITLTADAETGFGRYLPTRIEFWSDPVSSTSDSDQAARPEGRLITLIELYSIRPIARPPMERFRFENQDAEVNFANDTDRYIQRYGVELSASQRRLLRR